MNGDSDPAVLAVAESNQQHGKPVYWLDAPPTAENIVAELARVAQELVGPHDVRVVRIRLWETPQLLGRVGRVADGLRTQRDLLHAAG